MRRRAIEVTSTAQAFADMKADYAAARPSRHRRTRTGIAPSGAGADYHYRSEADYLRLMENARDMDRNDVVVGQAIDRAVTNTIQDGFRLDPDTGDDDLDQDLVERWEAWGENPDDCDAAGEHSFKELEYFSLRAAFVDGDMVSIGTQDGQLEMIEAHRIRTPRNTKRNVVHGVLLDASRKRLEYWITKEEVDPFKPVSRVSDITPRPVRDALGGRILFHTYLPKRVSQTRGVTALAPIFDVLDKFEDIQFAKLIQAQIVSCFAIFRQQSGEGGFVPDKSVEGAVSTQTLGDGATRTIEGIAPGMDIVGAPGEELKGFSPNVPNPEFFDHVRLMLTLVGINLGLPLILVLMDGSETNFSGWRGAFAQAKLGFQRNQRRLCERFHRPVYLWKLQQWIADDPVLRKRANAIGARITKHTWNKPIWEYIEPVKDVTADLIRVRNGLTSPRRRARERGTEWNQVAREISEDNRTAIVLAKETAADINKQFSDDPNPVHWREVLSLPMADGVKITMQAGSESEPDEPNDASAERAGSFTQEGDDDQ